MNNVLKWVGITIGGFITIMILVVIGVNIFVPEEELVRVRKQGEAKAARKLYLKDSTEKAQARMDSLGSIEVEKMELQGIDEEESKYAKLDEYITEDGRMYALELLIKESMNDPDSFEHVRTQYEDKGKYMLVRITARGKNQFGALVLSSYDAKVGFDGSVISLKENL